MTFGGSLPTSARPIRAAPPYSFRDGRGAENSQAELGRDARVVALDVNDAAGARSLFSELGRVDHVFITAGTVLFAPKLESDLAAVRPSMETRFWGVLCGQIRCD